MTTEDELLDLMKKFEMFQKNTKIMNPPEFIKKDYIGLNGVGINQLIHPHFNLWQDYFLNNYKIKKNIKMILFIPCAAIKPYYNSPIHREINKIIDKYPFIQKIVISNAGIIPYEYCDNYPFDSYDWNPLLETEEIKQEYITITSERIYNFFYFKKNDELVYISYLRNDSESLFALKEAFKKLDLKIDEIKISGNLHSTADSDLLLILENNLLKLKKTIKNILTDKLWNFGQVKMEKVL